MRLILCFYYTLLAIFIGDRMRNETIEACDAFTNAAPSAEELKNIMLRDRDHINTEKTSMPTVTFFQAVCF